MSNGNHTTLAIMSGELRTITVEAAVAGEDLVVHAAPGAMTTRAVSALRAAYPAARIVETGSSPGAVIHVVQAPHDMAALQAAHASDQ